MNIKYIRNIKPTRNHTEVALQTENYNVEQVAYTPGAFNHCVLPAIMYGSETANSINN